MTVAHIIILLATGLGAGFFSGLLGLGGAVIMTPVQYIVYTGMGIAPDLAIKMAFGTSLLVILPTAISGTWRHHRNKAVWWRAAVVMGGCSLLGSLAGATLATHLPGRPLEITFGIVILLSGVRMFTLRTPEASLAPRDNTWLWIAWALPIGFVTGILGIGGGVMAVPVMAIVLRFRMHNAVATSLAMMILTSIGGIIGYIVNGLGVSGLPDHTIGYINLQSWLFLAGASVIAAQVGAITAYRLPNKQLRYVFVVIMLFLGLRMLGLFQWLGWSI